MLGDWASAVKVKVSPDLYPPCVVLASIFLGERMIQHDPRFVSAETGLFHVPFMQKLLIRYVTLLRVRLTLL